MKPVDLQRELGDEIQLAALAGLDTVIFGPDRSVMQILVKENISSIQRMRISKLKGILKRIVDELGGWASIASQLLGRTDNEIKNFWRTHLKKRLLGMGLTHTLSSPMGSNAVSSAFP
ncbi:hypothetical protein IFM89_030078 [Coptis chinensis]|uniref:Uncharacterized protein n=1 Tax=Coptis chinensis TaxID=261450 RepID=A0A835INH3_9MAGN|nr:hypothetical protein IFM89_030078 [Coptis chinensis]